MSKSILVIGESGSGKSTSLRNLDATSTYVINVIGKDLPFKGASLNYMQKEGGNLFVTDSPGKICTLLRLISDKREDIKTIVVDDFQYVMSNEFMRRVKTDRQAREVFDKYNDLAAHTFMILEVLKDLRNDLIVIFLSHSEKSDDGVIKFKTIGKLTDRMVTVEGRFTIVLHALAKDGGYWFKTNNDGDSTCKSPMGMFEDKLIPNDLNYVITKIKEF